ncbi:hypothetical protein [Pseudoroseomonas cervicalis]|uniref:hypothetical protein n=1 Tax=Teichococcus cervicalis TaxID=204525 RepID=UPI0022F1CE08|nr:hypothetical protein [Pseudoroseomonas cervicalis]WBV44542.1 hypothetical protein PFY06_08300 [Pseudoroseomonas cervicalis]
MKPEPPPIQRIATAEEAARHPDGSLLQWGDILVRPRRGARQALVFFNGAVNADKLAQAPLFQRWSWHPHFAPTLFFLSDPLVNATTGLRIAWYAGRREAPVLPALYARIDALARVLHGAPLPVTAFGSSAGGFAALMSAIEGHAVRALAINPQTNVLHYHARLRDAFLAHYGAAPGGITEADRLRLSCGFAAKRRPVGSSMRLHLWQNRSDRFHFEKHFQPLAALWDGPSLRGKGQASFELFDDAVLKHTPPPLERSLGWMRGVAPDLFDSA